MANSSQKTAGFTQKSRDVLKQLGLKGNLEYKIDALEKSQTLVTQLNNHTAQANVNLEGNLSRRVGFQPTKSTVGAYRVGIPAHQKPIGLQKTK